MLRQDRFQASARPMEVRAATCDNAETRHCCSYTKRPSAAMARKYRSTLPAAPHVLQIGARAGPGSACLRCEIASQNTCRGYARHGVGACSASGSCGSVLNVRICWAQVGRICLCFAGKPTMISHGRSLLIALSLSTLFLFSFLDDPSLAPSKGD